MTATWSAPEPARAVPSAVEDAVDVVQAWIDRRQRAMIRKLHSCAQSPAQLHVLGLLHDSGPTTVSQVGAHLGISLPSASAIVDRMVDAGLVARLRSEEDRRVVSVSLSEPGATALQQALGGRRELLSKVLSQLSDSELRDTVRLMNRLEEAIGSATATSPA